jgi:hypothetical protein
VIGTFRVIAARDLVGERCKPMVKVGREFLFRK